MKIQSIINELVKNGMLDDGDEKKVRQAYALAVKAHQGQKRKNGDPYIIHPEETALTVARWHLDVTTTIAALLHDVVEDAGVESKYIAELFGDEVAFLVDGVTKISKVKFRGDEAQAETLKKMILALSEDIRVVFVKLADRLHNMNTLSYLPPNKQHRIALETSEIYAPLAYRLGLGTVSGDLQDLAFPYLYPKEHRILTDMLKEHFQYGNKYVEKIRKIIEAEIQKQPIKLIRVDYRAKRISSLYKKMLKNEMNLDRIYDLIALRVIVETVEDCYAVLGLIHSLWPPLPGKIKDYIALPKPNGYRSIHTTVICEDGKPTEFQIRTEEMHHENEYGVAAYWAYSESKSKNEYKSGRAIFADAKQAHWINQLKSWQNEIAKSEEYIQSLKIDFFKDRIFVITPRGDVIDLPATATPVDFAYAIHTDIGNSCTGAKVNGRIAALSTNLESGDVVEIITQKNKKKPSEAWLEFVKSSRAKLRIRAAIRNEGGGLVPQSMKITIVSIDRMGLLKDVSSAFTLNRIEINSMNSTLSQRGDLATIKVIVPAECKDRLERTLLKIKKLEGVKEISFS